VIISFT